MSSKVNVKVDYYRKFGDVFGDTLSLVFRNIIPLTKAVVIFVGPLMLVYIICIALVAFSGVSLGGTNFLQPKGGGILSGYFSSLLFGGGILMLLSGFAMGLVLYLVLNSFLLRYGESADGQVNRLDIWADIKQHFWHFLGIAAIRGGVYFLFTLGMVWLDPPGPILLVLGLGILYLGVSTSFSDIIRMNEGGGVWNAISRSFELVNVSWWQTFGLYLVLAIFNVVSLVLLSFLAKVIGTALGSIMGNYVLVIIFSSALSFMVMVLLYTAFLAMFWAAAALQYFNLSDAPLRFSSAEDLIDQIGKNPEDSVI